MNFGGHNSSYKRCVSSKIKLQRLSFSFLFSFSPAIFYVRLDNNSNCQLSLSPPPNFFHTSPHTVFLTSKSFSSYYYKQNYFLFHIHLCIHSSMGSGIKGNQHNSIRLCLNKTKLPNFHKSSLLLRRLEISQWRDPRGGCGTHQ